MTTATADYLTPAQVAELLRCGPDTVHRAIKAQRLRAFRDGRLVRIRREDLNAYLDQHTR